MRLLGTLTSPYVRRIRVIGLELGLDLESVDTTTPEGKDLLTRLSPLQKIPVLEVGGVGVLDSHAITDLLLSQHGHGALRAPHAATQISEGNALHAADGALDAGIRLFYCRRDGVDIEALPFMRSERDRIGRTLAWLDQHVRGPWCTPDDGFGLAELALVTTLEWMRFRNIASLEPFKNLLAFVSAHAERPSLVATRAPGA
jgi:glutathione S-transferase